MADLSRVTCAYCTRRAHTTEWEGDAEDPCLLGPCCHQGGPMTDTEVEWNTVRHDCGCESWNGAGMLSWRWRPKSRCPDHERLDALMAAREWPEVDRLLAAIRGG